MTSNLERFLEAQIYALIVIFTTHKSVSDFNVPGSESMVFHGIFPYSFENLTVDRLQWYLRTYSGYTVRYSQDQVCDSNHAECVLFSQGDMV